VSTGKPLKKPHMLRCAQSPHYNVLVKYASAPRFFARLASEFFLSSLQTEFFNSLLRSPKERPEIALAIIAAHCLLLRVPYSLS
jgi:hypothetical protein